MTIVVVVLSFFVVHRLLEFPRVLMVVSSVSSGRDGDGRGSPACIAPALWVAIVCVLVQL